MHAKTRSPDSPEGSLPVREDIETGGDQLEEEFWAEATTVEHYRHAPVADNGLDFVEHLGQHLHHAGVRLSGDDEERVSNGIVDPIVGRCGHRQAHARDVRLR